MCEIKRIIIDCMHNKNISISSELKKFNPIIEICREYFPNVNFNPTTGVLQLSSGDKIKGVFFIEANRVFMDVQDVQKDENIGKIYDIYKNSIEKIVDNFEIDSFNRIGIRNFVLKKADSINEIDNILLNRYLKLDEQKLGKYGSNPNSIHFGFATSYKDYKINHNFGKLTNQNIRIQSGKVTTNEEHYFLYDIDCYKDQQTKSSDFIAFAVEAQQQIKICSNEYFSEFGEE